MKRIVFSIMTATVLWFVMFSPWTAPFLNFWWAMTASACVLITLSFIDTPTDRSSVFSRGGTGIFLQELLLGVTITVVLWGVFWIGNMASQWLFDFARPQVDTIYDMKTGTPPWLIGLLLLLIIGPAEELFWRRYVQQKFAELLRTRRFFLFHHSISIHSETLAFLLTTVIYTAVHIPSGNFMLVMAAMVCGVAWGGLYRLIPQHFTAILLSHAFWDAAAFVWFPL